VSSGWRYGVCFDGPLCVPSRRGCLLTSIYLSVCLSVAPGHGRRLALLRLDIGFGRLT